MKSRVMKSSGHKVQEILLCLHCGLHMCLWAFSLSPQLHFLQLEHLDIHDRKHFRKEPGCKTKGISSELWELCGLDENLHRVQRIISEAQFFAWFLFDSEKGYISYVIYSDNQHFSVFLSCKIMSISHAHFLCYLTIHIYTFALSFVLSWLKVLCSDEHF